MGARTGQTDANSGRLLSLDALRGFDMFWIMGADTAFQRLAAWSGGPWSEVVQTQLEHVVWEGFRFYDLIFPLFLFVVGVVIPFSLEKLRDRGESRSTQYGRIIRRTVLLFALGLLCNNVLQFDFANLRITGVLQRIAICYGAAALITMHTNARGQAILIAAILLGYWALLAFVPVPGGVAGDYTMQGNLGGYVDRHFLPGKILDKYYGYGDNEGLLSTIPAITTTLLGVLAGHWLRSRRQPWNKVFGLGIAGALALALGMIWGLWFPIIKNLWTSSFVLVAGGWSLLLLAFFYAVIDVLGYWRWAFFFIVIGANAITIYVVPRFLDFTKFTQFFFGGTIKLTGSFAPVALAIAILGMKWLFLLYLYRKKIFLRV